MLPKPEKHVFVCTQQRDIGHIFGSCARNKSEDTLMMFINEQKKRGLDGKVQVTNTGCLGGPCMSGPVVLVYPEGVKYFNVKTPEDVAEIFDKHLAGGEPVERLQVPADAWG